VLALIWPLPAAAQHGATHWEYEGEHGPAHWGTLDPAYHTCVAGTHQSPIDIRDARSGDLPAISFAYHPTALKLIDNGHTIQVNYAPGSVISVAGKQYELLQFHFHHPAEEQVSGTSYPMVAHLVHKSADGKLAVVAVLLAQGGTANDFIERLWKHLPAEQGKEISVQGVTLDVSTLLPATHGYFTYAGSLTTPPCTEGVTWFVLKTPVQISQSEIAAFAKKYPHNARPLQQLHGRVIQATK
jgi:carbonic anhydrase